MLYHSFFTVWCGHCEKEKPLLLFYERCTRNRTFASANAITHPSCLLFIHVYVLYIQKSVIVPQPLSVHSQHSSFIQVCGVPRTHRRTVYRWVCLCDSNNCRVLRGPTFKRLSSNLPTAVRCFFFLFSMLERSNASFFYSVNWDTCVKMLPRTAPLISPKRQRYPN